MNFRLSLTASFFFIIFTNKAFPASFVDGPDKMNGPRVVRTQTCTPPQNSDPTQACKVPEGWYRTSIPGTKIPTGVVEIWMPSECIKGYTFDAFTESCIKDGTCSSGQYWDQKDNSCLPTQSGWAGGPECKILGFYQNSSTNQSTWVSSNNPATSSTIFASIACIPNEKNNSIDDYMIKELELKTKNKTYLYCNIKNNDTNYNSGWFSCLGKNPIEQKAQTLTLDLSKIPTKDLNQMTLEVKTAFEKTPQQFSQIYSNSFLYKKNPATPTNKPKLTFYYRWNDMKSSTITLNFGERLVSPGIVPEYTGIKPYLFTLTPISPTPDLKNTLGFKFNRQTGAIESAGSTSLCLPTELISTGAQYVIRADGYENGNEVFAEAVLTIKVKGSQACARSLASIPKPEDSPYCVSRRYKDASKNNSAGVTVEEFTKGIEYCDVLDKTKKEEDDRKTKALADSKPPAPLAAPKPAPLTPFTGIISITTPKQSINLYDELVKIGWDTKKPVEKLTINISANVGSCSGGIPKALFIYDRGLVLTKNLISEIKTTSGTSIGGNETIYANITIGSNSKFVINGNVEGDVI
ncbi:MAG: hypothetical protein WCK43_09505, partial [bacterium]